jgi:uncharacterized repeat protein (TIGR03803 family)
MRTSRLIFTGLLAVVTVLSANAFASYTETVLYAFPKTGNVNQPLGLVVDPSGNFYGPAAFGGAFNNGGIFELSPTSSGWTSTVIYSFAGGTDGGTPQGSLVRDASGNLYGGTGGGTGTSCTGGCGQVYELSLTSSGWTKTTIHSFNTTDGAYPYSTLLLDSAGNLYGTTAYGGTYGHGVVFELSPSSTGWTETTLYSFKGGAQGYNASGPLAFDSQGRLYGTTQYGGSGCLNGCGTIYQLSPPTSTVPWWTYRRLHAFTGADGMNPFASTLIFDAAGNLYGTAPQGGNSSGHGVVFELSPTSSGGWKLRVLHSFAGANDGILPEAGLVFDQSGNLWGTAANGGLYGWGTVFEMTPTATGHWNLINQHSFANSSDGSTPQAPVYLDGLGNIFGVTSLGGTPPSGYGTFWELSPSTEEK